MRLRHLLCALCALVFVLSALFLAGCGGGAVPGVSDTRATGRATFTVKWPPPSTRLIPAAANSIVVALTQGTTTLATQTLARPATGSTASATFNSLPTGTLAVTATAYPNADGTGTAQATATTSIVIQANQNTPFGLTMASTIDHLQVSPTSLSISVGQVAPITVTAIDAAGNVVLISSQKLTWLSSNTAVATVDANGNVTGVAPGGTTSPVQITVTETESNKSASVPVTVSAVTGTLIAYDPFNYTPGSQLVGLSGGQGWNGPWQQNGPGASTLIGSDNLTYGNLVTSGHCAATQSGNPIGNAHPLATPLGISGTVVWFSILLRPIDPIGADNYGGYFSLNFGNLFIGKPGASSYYALDFLSGGDMVPTNVQAQQNVTVFLVVRATFKDGPDQFDLWVNPVPGQPLPAPDATKTDLDVGTFTSVNIGASTRCEFDEMRVGTSYASVSPTQ
jgi:hypothetical protein